MSENNNNKNFTNNYYGNKKKWKNNNYSKKKNNHNNIINSSSTNSLQNLGQNENNLNINIKNNNSFDNLDNFNSLDSPNSPNIPNPSELKKNDSFTFNTENSLNQKPSTPHTSHTPTNQENNNNKQGFVPNYYVPPIYNYHPNSLYPSYNPSYNPNYNPNFNPNYNNFIPNPNANPYVPIFNISQYPPYNPMITNFPHNPQNHISQGFFKNKSNNSNNLNNNQNITTSNGVNTQHQLVKKDVGISQFLKEYVNKKIDEKINPKEFKWIELEIKSLDDLIELSKDYGIKYSKDYEYQLDLGLLSTMVEELESLNKMIGLKSVKNQIVDLILFYALRLDNKNYDLLHTVIEGEPGTGKTELAEKLAKIYLKMGILKKNVFKKVRRSDLIAGYLGQTAIKTEKVLEECKGGVLFIDEAYSLGNAEGKDGRDSFSKECIDMINQWLTENKSDFVCIIAGYKDDLTKSFFSYNSGLERRFPIRFSIETYSDEELAKIFTKKVKECEWNIDCQNLPIIIKANRRYFKFNGGDMEVLFTKCKVSHSKNLLKEKDKKKKVLTETDIIEGIKIFLENPEIKKRGEDSLSKYLVSTMYC